MIHRIWNFSKSTIIRQNRSINKLSKTFSITRIATAGGGGTRAGVIVIILFTSTYHWMKEQSQRNQQKVTQKNQYLSRDTKWTMIGGFSIFFRNDLHSSSCMCESSSPSSNGSSSSSSSSSSNLSDRLRRKKTVLQQASGENENENYNNKDDRDSIDRFESRAQETGTSTKSSSSSSSSSSTATTLSQLPFFQKRHNTQQEMEKIRMYREEGMLERWERDEEEGWRELPARAWPVYQPKPEELRRVIEPQVKQHNCRRYNTHDDDDKQKSKSKKPDKADKEPAMTSTAITSTTIMSEMCMELLFQVATTLVFYNLDPLRGFEQYEALALQGHVESMVACGVVLVEGMGNVPSNERKGIEWLEKAVALDSAQGCYELGTLYYTGVSSDNDDDDAAAEILEEDPEKAFVLFERAAAQDHTAGLYMVADCLLEGEGTPRNIGRAVPLFYRAAERGHRFARQRIRELLETYRVTSRPM